MKNMAIFILVILPCILMGQMVTPHTVQNGQTDISALVTSVVYVAPIADSTSLHFRIHSTWNYVMGINVINRFGKKDFDILTSPRTDIILPPVNIANGGLTVMFNYN